MSHRLQDHAGHARGDRDGTATRRAVPRASRGRVPGAPAVLPKPLREASDRAYDRAQPRATEAGIAPERADRRVAPPRYHGPTPWWWFATVFPCGARALPRPVFRVRGAGRPVPAELHAPGQGLISFPPNGSDGRRRPGAPCSTSARSSGRPTAPARTVGEGNNFAARPSVTGHTSSTLLVKRLSRKIA